ncbi:MAG: dehydratase [Pseudonocardiales bacterium]|nr:dehydratase [Pseudonocardiales bacterium]
MMGLYFEDMIPGTTVKHLLTRTVTEMDNVLFTSITMNLAPLHLDAEYAKTLPYGRQLVNSLYTVGLIGGMTVPDLFWGTSLGNLGYDKITFPNPVFHGDTLRAETDILDKRESQSKNDRGIVWLAHRGINQRDEIVVDMLRTGMAMKRPVTTTD